MLKLAKEKKKTYPFSRAYTHPATTAGLLGTAGAIGGSALAKGKGKLLGALAGGAAGAGLGYGSGRLQREIDARGLKGRVAKGESWRLEREKDYKLKKGVSKKKTHEISRALTSPIFGAVSGGPTGVVQTGVRRIISERGMRGRMNRGGKGLYPTERKLELKKKSFDVAFEMRARARAEQMLEESGY